MEILHQNVCIRNQDFGLEATLGSSQRSEYWGSVVVFSHE